MNKILLFMRRFLIISFGGALLYFAIFNGNAFGDCENNTDDGGICTIGSKDNLTNLGSKYETDGVNIYYKGELVKFVNANEFSVMKKSEVKEISGMLINSDNLLLIFQDYDMRIAMMNSIDDIILNKKNVTNTLKDSSENGMYKMKSDYDNLSQYTWKDQGVLTAEQKAKFAIVYLYVKIIRSTEGTVYMEQALAELKDFLENFDASNLKKEVTNKNIRLKGDIGMDKHCIFLNGQLYACFLDEIF